MRSSRFPLFDRFPSRVLSVLTRPEARFLAIGAILGVAIGLGCGPSGPPKDSNYVDRGAGIGLDPKLAKIVVARVGDRKILVEDIDWKMKVQMPEMMSVTGRDAVKQRRDVLAQMLDQYCWVYEAEQKGYDKNKEFVDVLELSRKYILANHCAELEVYSRCNPTDEEVKAHYEENLDQFRIIPKAQAQMLVSSSRAKAEQARARALRGDDFPTLCGEFSDDPLYKERRGETFAVTARAPLTGFEQSRELNEAILELKAGQISEPIATPRGFAVVRCVEKVEEGMRSFEEVKADLAKRLKAKRTNELYSSTLARIREEAKAAILEEGWDEYRYSFLTPDEIFGFAQEEQAPDSRIRDYEAIAKRYPDSPRAPQALFMVGFTLADELKEYEKARKTFAEFVKKYPNDELARSAQWMLDNMEKGTDNLPQAPEIKRRALLDR